MNCARDLQGGGDEGAAGDLGLENVGGVFLVLGVGVALAVLVAFGELFWDLAVKAHNGEVSRVGHSDAALNFHFPSPQFRGEAERSNLSGSSLTMMFCRKIDLRAKLQEKNSRLEILETCYTFLFPFSKN